MMTRALSWSVDCVRRLLGLVYYEFLFDTGTPLSHALASRVVAWEQARGKGDTPIPPSLWEQQYGEGHWDFLHTLGELGRFSVMVGYLRELTPDGALLDVGCGEGLLYKRMQPRNSPYLGLDISASAIEKARASKGGTFVCADAEQFVVSDTYDVIIFNESLYYFSDPVGTVARYSASLRPHGILMVSTFLRSRRGRAILRALKRAYTLIDETSIGHGTEAWTCSVLAPSRRRRPEEDAEPTV
jgi:2-polyprenyl-3-methyl-5-hydroxy-6-metoxy-1,4-benzoquinol methylase